MFKVNSYFSIATAFPFLFATLSKLFTILPKNWPAVARADRIGRISLENVYFVNKVMGSMLKSVTTVGTYH